MAPADLQGNGWEERGKMGWIETIRVNFGRRRPQTEGVGVLDLVENELASLKNLQWEVYRNPSVKEDIMFILRWDGPRADHLGSDLALTLVRELKRHGLVDHAVWAAGRDGKEDADPGEGG
jgi:hypothetical protein